MSIATRPDCLGDDIIDLLKELNSKKPVWVELGLQTIHDKTAHFIRRGYELPVFENALNRLKKAGLTVIVHVILGLPGETTDQMKETVKYLADQPLTGSNSSCCTYKRDRSGRYLPEGSLSRIFYGRIHRPCDRLYHSFASPDHHTPYDR